MRVQDVRRALVARAFAGPLARAALGDAVARLGFVQADPIRAPARAQDLVLRHRVRGYRAGDLERHYPALGLDEGFVYAYGFVPPDTHRLLHPRGGPEPAGLERDVLAFVRRAGPTHPDALLEAFGARRETNYWGGQSRAATRALERLHYWGHLRVVRRDAGVRVYAAAEPLGIPLDPAERLRRLTLLVARLLGPLPTTSLRGALYLMRHALPGVDGRATVVARLLQEGALERGDVDGVPYVWPAGAMGERTTAHRVGARVRLLAPFDPVVWDRRRVEHLWAWDYRFEAYTPAPKRRFGYYALPLLWRDQLIGWANVTRAPFDVALGFVDRRPRDAAFARALDAEIARLEQFLRP